MARSFLESSPRSRELFELGSRRLDLDLIEAVLEGPEDLLGSTRVSQPAIFLHSMAVLDALGQRLGSDQRFARELRVGATAGLSLGEYSALVCAGSLDFEEALEVVVARGRYMQEACDESRGTMVSLLGLESSKVEEAVSRAASKGIVGIANYNSPDQTVLSGEAVAVEEAARVARELGCRRAIPLRVAGAYHSPLMASATAKLRPALENLAIRPPRCAFYANVSGQRVGDPEEIRAGLIRQVERPVRWVDTIRAMVGDGLEVGLELGPGKVIAGLVRNVDRGVRVLSVGELPGLADAVEIFKKDG